MRRQLRLLAATTAAATLVLIVLAVEPWRRRPDLAPAQSARLEAQSAPTPAPRTPTPPTPESSIPLLDFSSVSENSTIFFTETDPALEHFPGMKLCAFESAAAKNPTRPLIVVLPVNTAMREPPELNFPNLSFFRLDHEALIAASPAASLWNNKVRCSRWERDQLSDLVRVLLLHRFGGAYLDSDTASRAAVPDDVGNFIMEDRSHDVNGAVMQFDRGHPFLEFAIGEMDRIEDWEGQGRAAVGPKLLSGCHATKCPEGERLDSKDTRILHRCPSLGYSVLSKSQGHLFSTMDYLSKPLATLREGLEASGAFVVHYFGSNMRLVAQSPATTFGPRTPLYLLIRESCPLSDRALLEDFVAASKWPKPTKKTKKKNS